MRNAESVFTLLLVISVITTAAGVAIFQHTERDGVVLALGCMALTSLLIIVPHELGHALAALAVGMRLFSVTLGTRGRILFVRRILGYDIICHRGFMGGVTQVAPRYFRFVKLRFFLGVLAGPVLDGTFLALGLWLAGRYSKHDSMHWVFTGISWGAGIQLVGDLFPHMVRMGHTRVPSDGLQLLVIPFASWQTIAVWHAMRFSAEAVTALQRDRVDDAEDWLAKGMEAYPDKPWEPLRGSILLHRRQYAAAREAFHKALSQNVAPELRPILWNNIAWTDVMLADPALAEEADSFSRQALETLPWASYVRGTRGTVLIEQGPVDQGMRLLTQAYNEWSQPKGKALDACYLAIGMVRQGDIPKAYEYLDLARKYDPTCPLIERATKVLQSRETDSVITCRPAYDESY